MASDFLLPLIKIAPFLMGEMGIGEMLQGFDFVGIVFGVLSELTFLVDVFIASALVAAIIRGIFKNFWKVVWRGVIFVILLILLFSLAGVLAPTVGMIGIGLKGTANGVEMDYQNLAQTIHGVTIQAGYSEAYALAFTEVVLKNLTIFLGIMAIAIITPLISAITFPLINLAIPKRVKKLKLIPAKLAISLALSVIAIMVMAIPMATLVPPMTAFKAMITEDTLMHKFLKPEVISFLELFTVEHSILLKAVNLGNVSGSLNVFTNFKVGETTVELSAALPELFQHLNNIPYSPPAAG